MPGIYIMALITVTLSALILGGSMYAMFGLHGRYLWLMLPGLASSYLVNVWVKGPVARWVGEQTGLPLAFNFGQPLWFLLFLLFLAPVTEEIIKALPVLIPPLNRYLDQPIEAVRAGMMLGISFGLGEAIYLAYGIAQSPEYAGMPWYYFGGFSSERFVVTLGHGALTVWTVYGLQRGGRWLWGGFLISVFAHALVNLPVPFFQLGLISGTATSLILMGVIALLVIAFERLYRVARGKSDKLVEDMAAAEMIYFQRKKME